VHTLDPDPPQDEAPASPSIPSFDSLRDPRRRSPIDLLVPIPTPPPTAAPTVAPPAVAAAPRPPDYADLLRLGVHLARFSAGVPLRLARWSAGIPVRGLRRLLGG
jgi:hypothetical protein